MWKSSEASRQRPNHLEDDSWFYEEDPLNPLEKEPEMGELSGGGQSEEDISFWLLNLWRRLKNLLY